MNTEITELDLIAYCTHGDLEWRGCYGSGAKYQKYTIPESTRHPAKMSWDLLERIYKHLEMLNLLTTRSVVIDFMAGSGRTGTVAALRRYRTISVELEPHFIEMIAGYDCDGKSISEFKIEPCVCKSETMHRPHKIKTGLFEVECSGNPRIVPVCRCGDRRHHKKHHVIGNKELLEQVMGRKVRWDILQGDARELSKLLYESELKLTRFGSGSGFSSGSLSTQDKSEFVAVVSPPYFSKVAYQDKEFIKSIAEDKSQRYRDGRLKGHFATPEAIRRSAEKIMENYSLDPRNIGNLKDMPLSESINAINNIGISYDRRNRLGMVGGVSGWGGEFHTSQGERQKDYVQERIFLATIDGSSQQIPRIDREGSEIVPDPHGMEENESWKLSQSTDNIKNSENNPTKNNSLSDNQKVGSDSSFGSTEFTETWGERRTSRSAFRGVVSTDKGEPQKTTEHEKLILNHHLPDKPALVSIFSPPYCEAQQGGGIAIQGYRGPHIHEMGKNQPDKVGERCGYMKEVHGNDPANIGNLKDIPLVAVVSPPYQDTAMPMGCPSHIRELAREGDWDKAIELERKVESENVKKGNKYAVSTDETIRNKIEMALEREKGNYSENPDNIGNLKDIPYNTRNRPDNQKDESYLSAMLKVYQQAFLCGISPLVVVTKDPTRNGKLRMLSLDSLHLLKLAGYEIFDYHRAILFESHRQETLDGESKDVHKGRISFFKRLSLEKGNTVAQFEDIIFARIPNKCARPISELSAPDSEG